MRKFILDYPSQFRIGFEIAKDVKIKGNFKNVTICGIGGSALPADLVRTVWQYGRAEKPQPPISITTNRSYYLPNIEKNLVLISSYSGNTEEAIECFRKAKKKGLPIIGFAKGGKVETLCKKNKLPFIQYPDNGPDFQPRFALGYSFSAIATVLKKQLGFQDKDLLSIEKKLQKFDYEEEAKALAKKIVGKIPMVYTGDQLKILARIWKIKFNETSKTPASWNYFPELNHNEMVGYTNAAEKFHLVILKDPKDHPRNLKRIEVTSKLLRDKGAEVTIIDLPNENIFVKVFANLWLADWVTYYLALEYKMEPIPVKMVEDLKKMLA